MDELELDVLLLIIVNHSPLNCY